MAEGIVELNKSNWDAEITNYQGYAMVDFWAVWCGPCRMIAPTIEELAKEYAGKLKVCKLNTDDNPDIAGQFKIMGIPTIIFFKNGQKVDQLVGAVPKSQLKAKIESIIN